MSKTIKVQKGEGPWQVARRAGISLDELYRLNPKAKKMIHPDQELVINDGTTTTATVKKGEGPWQVAQRMGVSLEDVYKYNPKARKMIYPGDKLTIPIKQGTKKDTDSNQETKSSDTNSTSTSNNVANDSIKNNANKTTSSPVKGNAQPAPKDTTKTQVAPKDTVGTNKPSNKTNTKPTTKQPSDDERFGQDSYYVNKYYRDNTPSKTKPKKDLETTVRQWNARKKNPNRGYRSAYDSYAPAVGPRKVSQTRRLDAIYDLGAAVDIDPTFLIGKGTPYTAPPVVSKNTSNSKSNPKRIFDEGDKLAASPRKPNIALPNPLFNIVDNYIPTVTPFNELRALNNSINPIGTLGMNALPGIVGPIMHYRDYAAGSTDALRSGRSVPEIYNTMGSPYLNIMPAYTTTYRVNYRKGTPYIAPPVVSKKNPSKEENSMNRLFLSPANNLIKRLPSFNNPMGPLVGLTEEGMLGIVAPAWVIGKGIDGLGYDFPIPSWNHTVRQNTYGYLMDLEDTFNEGFGLSTRKRNGGPLARRRLESAGILSI